MQVNKGGQSQSPVHPSTHQQVMQEQVSHRTETCSLIHACIKITHACINTQNYSDDELVVSAYTSI